MVSSSVSSRGEVVSRERKKPAWSYQEETNAAAKGAVPSLTYWLTPIIHGDSDETRLQQRPTVGPVSSLNAIPLASA